MPDGRPPSSKWLRYSGIGLELAAAVAVPTLLGAWIDRRWGSEPWGFLAGFCLGIGGGLYRFIRTATTAMRQAGPGGDGSDRNRQPQPEKREREDERPG